MDTQFEVGTKVKIVAPEGFNLDEYYAVGEWYDIHYFAFMKDVVGNTVQITGNAFDPERNCVEVFYENEIYEFPASWLVPVESRKIKPKPSGKDFLGNTIYIGDEVVYARKGYRSFQVGKILNITPTGVRIEVAVNPYGLGYRTFFQTFDQIVKKP